MKGDPANALKEKPFNKEGNNVAGIVLLKKSLLFMVLVMKVDILINPLCIYKMPAILF
jgi:hypothetical protein